MVVVSVVVLGISVGTVMRSSGLVALVVFVIIVVCGGIWLSVLCVVREGIWVRTVRGLTKSG